MTRDDDSFVEFVSTRSASLLRLSVLLAGGDREAAEDWLQIALARAYVAWGRIDAPEASEAYVRRILSRTAATQRGRWWRRREVSMPDVPHQPGADHASAVDQRLDMWRVLALLTPRQRAVVVLRYYEDLTEAQIAEVLGCSTGAVKSHASRAVAALRAVVPVPADAHDATRDPGAQV